jgi:putative DNA primase/helicase
MGGCDGWSGLDLTILKGGPTVVMLDTNIADVKNVRRALQRLVAHLQKLKIDIYLPPPYPEDLPLDVNGPDDVLALPNGDEIIGAMLDNRVPAVSAPFSDHALASRFANEEQDVRYDSIQGKWYVWEVIEGGPESDDKTYGARWKEDEALAMQYMQGFLHRMAMECGDDREAKQIRSEHKRREVQFAAGRLAPMLVNTEDYWDTDPMLLNTPKGTVDLRTGKMRKARREDYCTKMTAVAPDSKQSIAQFHKFKDKILDKERLAYLQRAGGYMLTGKTGAHAFFFFYGTGRNGKSVTVDLLTGIMGDYAKTAPMTTFMSTHNPEHTTDLARLRGARLVAASEINEGERWNEARLASMTGGDRIAARFMRQDFFEYKPQYKLIISGNHKPQFRNVGPAMRDRIQLVPFEVYIPPEKRIKDLDEKLREWGEWPGILQWFIEGCLAYLKQDLTPPEVVTEATRNYMDDQDILMRWKKDRTVDDPNGKVPPKPLYDDYLIWSQQAGEHLKLSLKQFSQRLLESSIQRTKHGGNQYKLKLNATIKKEEWEEKERRRKARPEAALKGEEISLYGKNKRLSINR